MKGLCVQAGVSRELFYRWMNLAREAALKALEAKPPGPKRVKAEDLPKELIKLKERLARQKREIAKIRRERDHLKLVVKTAKRIIRRNAWGPFPKVSKKNGMQAKKRDLFILGNGRLKKPAASQPAFLPVYGESVGLPIGGGLQENSKKAENHQ